MTDHMIPILAPTGPSTIYYVVATGQTPIFMSRDYGSAETVWQAQTHSIAAAFGATTSSITLSQYVVNSVGWITVEILAQK